MDFYRLRQDGRTFSNIASVVGTSYGTIYRAVERNVTFGNSEYRYHGGRTRATSQREDRFIRMSVRRRRTLNASQVNAALRATTGNVISSSTLRRRLHEQGLRARRQANCPRLLPIHRAARRRWAEAHQNWGLAEWSRCMFSDECRFSLYQSDGRILVWRERNERFLEENMVAKEAFGGGSITVWGGIMRNGRTDLDVLVGRNMNAYTYRDECINNVVIPFAENFGNDFVFIDDNARPHRARIVEEVFRNHNIERMDWPARSPDMNAIEHVWSAMKRRLNERGVEFRDTNDLANAIREEWEVIPQNFLAALVDSMPRRVEDVCRSCGGPTRY